VRDLILIGGGLFLLWSRPTMEIYDSLEGSRATTTVEQPRANAGSASLLGRHRAAMIAVIDIVFSLDSVITAVGLAKHVPVMVIAIMISVGVMMFAAKAIGDFVDNHPSIKILALSFLVLVGTLLVAEGFGQHVSKGYVYFAMAFSLLVEMLNIRMRKKTREPVQLHKPEGAE
jgi:predicted tellurium resistance membrane protein TerC